MCVARVFQSKQRLFIWTELIGCSLQCSCSVFCVCEVWPEFLDYVIRRLMRPSMCLCSCPVSASELVDGLSRNLIPTPSHRRAPNDYLSIPNNQQYQHGARATLSNGCDIWGVLCWGLVLWLLRFFGIMQYNIRIFSGYGLVADNYYITGAGSVKFNMKIHNKLLLLAREYFFIRRQLITWRWCDILRIYPGNLTI